MCILRNCIFSAGGLPLLLGSNSESPKVYHTFSRIHGDIERDYNFFQIDTSYYSQGPGIWNHNDASYILIH